MFFINSFCIACRPFLKIFASLIYFLRSLLRLHLKLVKADWRLQIHESILMHGLHAPDFKFPRATNEENVADLFFRSCCVIFNHFILFFFSVRPLVLFSS